MLGDKLREIFDKLSGKRFITEDTLNEIAKEIQKALIVSDVNIKQVLEISNKIKALKGEKIPENVDEKDYIIKKIYDILAENIGFTKELPNARKILLIGLFGAGKTTTAGKLANYFKKQKKSVGLIAADTFRMAAYEQLKQYAKDFEVFGNTSKDPAEVIKQGLEKFKNKDIVIVDSAGRNAIDEELKKELENIIKILKPDLTLLVMQADIGQIALKQANEFNQIVKIDGIILTKLDGSAKGGGALTAANALKIPIYFIGTGEKIDDLEKFNPTRYLSRIMGYGDLEGLLEKIKDIENEDIDIENFDFNTFKKQINLTKKIGSFGKIANMLGLGKFLNSEMQNQAEEQINKFNYIIDSMTKYERTHPGVLNNSRIKRIAKGSGTSINDVRLLIKQFKTMKETFDMLKGKTPNEKDLEALMQKQMMKKARKKFKIK